jgi:hypothetical protein
MTPLGRILSLIAALCVGIGAYLPWTTFLGGEDVSALKLRSQWAFGLGGDRTTDVWPESVLFVLLVAAALILAGAIVGSAAVTAIGGVVSAAAVLAWIVQLNDLTGASTDPLWSHITTGAGLAGAGALLALGSAAFMRVPSNQPALMD